MKIIKTFLASVFFLASFMVSPVLADDKVWETGEIVLTNVVCWDKKVVEVILEKGVGVSEGAAITHIKAAVSAGVCTQYPSNYFMVLKEKLSTLKNFQGENVEMWKVGVTDLYDKKVPTSKDGYVLILEKEAIFGERA